MLYSQGALLFIGIVALIIGYRKNSRNILVMAAIVLFLSAGLNDLINGFNEGFAEANARH
jgi:hypothetical protein